MWDQLFAGAAQPVQADAGRTELVEAARSVAAEARGKAYKWGGHTTAGFDCSGYVIYTLRQAYPDRGFSFMTAAQIFADRRFTEVDTPQPGDLIGFPRARGAVDHVGIVLDAGHWIGSQSSTGVAPVRMDNPYWSARRHIFLRLR
jgi:cell wall-associated NlpC family hydrolase